MSYKEKDTISTGIHTRIDDKARVSSAWRKYGNENFESHAWETILWVDEKIAEMYDACRSADAVVEMHIRIINEYRTKAAESTEPPNEVAADKG